MLFFLCGAIKYKQAHKKSACNVAPEMNNTVASKTNGNAASEV
jgi:hypothetical protein